MILRCALVCDFRSTIRRVLAGMGRAYSGSAVHNAQFLHDGSNGCAGLESRRLSVAVSLMAFDARLIANCLRTEAGFECLLNHVPFSVQQLCRHPLPF